MADGLDLAELFRRTAQANAKLSKAWMDLSLAYVREISGIFGGVTDAGPVTEVDSGAGALVLEGEAGSVVHGTFLVSNDMDKPVSCAFVGSDFRDPRGTTVPARAAFAPATLELGAGEQRVVQVSIAVDERLAAGVGYAGEISVKGMDGFSVPVVLRRQHVVDEIPVHETQPGSAPRHPTPAASRPSAGRTAKTRKRKKPAR